LAGFATPPIGEGGSLGEIVQRVDVDDEGRIDLSNLADEAVERRMQKRMNPAKSGLESETLAHRAALIALFSEP
jgi:hypothetical protein